MMSVADLEIELARIRDPARVADVSNATPMSVDEALAFRDAGNLPDEHGRTLRLVLRTEGEGLSEKRSRYEPDYHREPSWRREGSRPVNVVPLTTGDTRPPAEDEPWWERSDVAILEREWRATGTVAGLAVPGSYRSFVLKTISSLQRAGVGVTVDTVASSLARWLSADQAREIRRALEEANEPNR